ncbi:hypothetical protein BGZ61DRAFT_343682 [Ilyonectria robusta]|uniref:uncharacterized protein n=1 Tax=Ilyonectria robusta TaxID=1079257 RepID=UPI001E8D241B|nr:uncharacterized protein BGZ61DRAFT_343682 [Ilyonectria robusta]KAH8734610.1 hypothetical protein BGZ61DRAFT_343682 [Ilyonectria robusta]
MSRILYQQLNSNSKVPSQLQPIANALKAGCRRTAHMLSAWVTGPGRHLATAVGGRVVRRVRANLSARRVLSFPHMLVLIWMVVLLYGERWIFDSKVADCDWASWEKWPKGTKPHHLIFVADPQLIDPHSYPGRPWPINPLTVTITDNYLRHGYKALQRHLHPDSVFFLGDLFDGGREWKTRKGKFVDPKWGYPRHKDEKAWVETWHNKYGEEFWMEEYERFANIFFDNWKEGNEAPGPWQRGRKLVASLPGNHDLGFGAQVQVPVRDRFSAFFGDVNRVDIIGNHTIVSVDGLSLSAGTSSYRDKHDLRPIYGPVHQFLDDVKAIKRRAVEGELSFWHGTEKHFAHEVEELNKADLGRFPHPDVSDEAPEFPTILLTHVPLYRNPGTPCGPRREHWPPSKPPKGQEGPVNPDNRNAISVTGGYQYQNVLNEVDSVKLIKDVGNVIHVFSGDDHDYCEVVHSPAKEGVREITVKSMSMAMGVPTPGFLMVSLYNPVDAEGKPLPDAPEATLQTHLCLLPNQIHTYMQYIVFGIATAVLLTVRALLVPAIPLTPFALEPIKTPTILPVYKDKVEPPESFSGGNRARSTSTGASSHYMPSRLSAAAPRGVRSTSPHSSPAARWQARRGGRSSKRWGWGDDGGPRIHLDTNLYDGAKTDRRVGSRKAIGIVGRELWTTMWRVVWMAALFWAYLTRQG